MIRIKSKMRRINDSYFILLQGGNVVEEIHSSFEDLSVTREESKIKRHLQADPTIHFDHGHVNIATE